MTIKIFHFHNGSSGGVLSVIKNLLKYSNNPAIENHVIYTINNELVSSFTKHNLEGAETEEVFYYSPKWNFYYTCRQLASFLPDDKAIIIAHDWLELGMVSNLGLQNPVVHFLHGCYDYYFDLAFRHEISIDKFIVVADDMYKKLQILIPQRRDDIHYLRAPVRKFIVIDKVNEELNIVFLGRLTHEKGYYRILEIAKALSTRNLVVNWHIIGITDSFNQIDWGKDFRVEFHGSLDISKIQELLVRMNIILLPSIAEGMPISIVEAMKCGVIPIVNEIDGGLKEIVINQKTGFIIEKNEVEGYVNAIELIYNNSDLAKQLSKNSIELANKLFDPFHNTKFIEDIITTSLSDKTKRSFKSYGSRLGHPLIPNKLVNFLRSQIAQ